MAKLDGFKTVLEFLNGLQPKVIDMADNVVDNINSTQQTSAFQQILEAVEALPIDAQITLVTIIQQRLHQQKRQELEQDILDSEQDYEAGNFHQGTVSDLMAELDDE